MNTFIGQIAKKSPYVSTETKNYEIDQLFIQNPNLQGIVIVDEDEVIQETATILKNNFDREGGFLPCSYRGR